VERTPTPWARLGATRLVYSFALALFALAALAAYGPGSNASPSIDSRVANTLVVWADQRRGGPTNIYGARVNPGGKVLDPAGIAISTARDSQLDPQVAFDGVNYLVVWTDDRPADEQFDVYGTRVTRAGVVLDRTGIPIATAAKSEFAPAVAFDGGNYLVVWMDFRSGIADIYGARVSRAGAVLDRAGFPISRARDEQVSPSVAFDGTNYFVAWSDSRIRDNYDIFGARVSREGTVLDPAGIAISEAGGVFAEPSVAFGSGDYLVVWSGWIGSKTSIFGARVNQAGTVRDPNGIRISIWKDQSEPRVAFNGRNYYVAWAGGRAKTVDVYGSRVSRAGSVLNPSGRPVARGAGNQWVQSVAFNGANYLVAWEKELHPHIAAAQTTDVWAARVSRAGTRLDRASIALPSAKRRRR
jgi:hypothetical protein